MTDEQPTPIKGQDSSYRRGLVLGLTMAEVMVLILFMLLLSLGALITEREQAIAGLKRRIASLDVVERFVQQLVAEKPSLTITDIVQKIERQEKENNQLRAEIAQMRPDAQVGSAINDIVREINRNQKQPASTAQIVEKLRALGNLKADNDTLKGQVAQLSNQIKSAGRGNEFPSCWVTPDGKTQSIFELVLVPGGIAIHDHTVPERAKDKLKLPIQNISYGRELSVAEFSEAVSPLYQWSRDHGCRFYVIPATSMAAAPIASINQMNAYFYPDSRILNRNALP
jgi:hypothetical protein